MLVKANCQMHSDFDLGVRTLVRLWQTAVRPTVEYGAEVWGEQKWNEAEHLQQMTEAKRILRCSHYVSCGTVTTLQMMQHWANSVGGRFELDGIRLKAMSPTRLAKVVYEVSAAMLEEKRKHSKAGHDHQLQPRRTECRRAICRRSVDAGCATAYA